MDPTLNKSPGLTSHCFTEDSYKQFFGQMLNLIFNSVKNLQWLFIYWLLLLLLFRWGAFIFFFKLW